MKLVVDQLHKKSTDRKSETKSYLVMSNDESCSSFMSDNLSVWNLNLLHWGKAGQPQRWVDCQRPLENNL